MTSLARVSPTLSDIEFGYARERTPIVEDDEEDEIVWPVSTRVRASDSSTSSSPAPAAPLAPEPKEIYKKPGHRRAATVALHQFNISDINNENTFNTADDDAQGGTDAPDVYSFDVFDAFELIRGDGGERAYVPPSERARVRARGHRKTQSDSSLTFARSAPASGARQQQRRPFQPRPPKTKVRPRLETLDPLVETWADDVDGLAAPMERLRVSPSSPVRSRSEQAKTREARGPRKPKGVPAPEAAPKSGSKLRAQRGPKRKRGGIAAKEGEKERGSPANSYPSPEPSRTPSPATATDSPDRGTAVVKGAAQKKEKPRRTKNKAHVNLKEAPPPEVPSPAPSTPRGLGARSLVDDISEFGDALVPSNGSSITEHDRLLGMAYEESVKFMNAFIEHPDHYTSQASRLTFLQALIVELGIVSTDGPAAGSLPGTLTGAKALLKSHAFLNVRDYLEVRKQGVEALRGAMKSSRSALTRELRGRGRGEDKRGRRAPLGWVKETGLTVLLVTL